MKIYNKAEFIERLAQKGYTKKDSSAITDDVFATITEIMAEGDGVRFQGFGSFEVRESAAREYIDYQTKERVTSTAHNSPKFEAGNVLRRAVREGIVRE